MNALRWRSLGSIHHAVAAECRSAGLPPDGHVERCLCVLAAFALNDAPLSEIARRLCGDGNPALAFSALKAGRNMAARGRSHEVASGHRGALLDGVGRRLAIDGPVDWHAVARCPRHPALPMRVPCGDGMARALLPLLGELAA